MLEGLLSLPPVTQTMLVLNVAIGAYTLLVNPELIDRWAFKPFRVVREREWSRWLTAGFVHVNGMHLAFNMITLYFFGPYVEAVMGPWNFLVVYLGSELTANALTFWKHRDAPQYSAVGASGAISGVLFAFCLFEPFAMLGIMFVIPMPAILFAVLYVVLSIYASKREIGRVAHEAHLGGALGGLALTILLYPAAVSIFLDQIGLR
ncbi:rhomboid family intramembrane serine protease [Rubrivirga sp. IMCC43871]|uniref:rhomboid family intramembrane serine protease n=1 Tax=Rubrivirga sp. IMCC43871 TaxID=3391575 RepID=UPI00398FC149